ncbi:unnamed protein product [Paramecium octaurelia]|uniref:Uncharacterized protein n=1 Tax=Paramecium octaurelia TaxID=43137 RepID=A0A8S1YKQ1_PAROT|nr:unnamed protein product [Paramecium octaurelia]
MGYLELGLGQRKAPIDENSLVIGLSCQMSLKGFIKQVIVVNIKMVRKLVNGREQIQVFK